jgi:hypothetical protein
LWGRFATGLTISRGGAGTMKTKRWPWLCTMGIMLASLAGCQTWVPVPGMTLPSGHYLEHPPQYFPQTPPFPLSRELATMEAQSAQAGPGGPLPAPLLPPVPAAQ